jgi:DNA helicase-2/ATP-dependent DNA helicase PcrA
VDNADLTDFRITGAVDGIIDFATNTLTGVGAPILRPCLRTLFTGKARNPSIDAETAALNYVKAPPPPSVVAVLVETDTQQGMMSLRTALLRTCIKPSLLVPTQMIFTTWPSKRKSTRVLGCSRPRRAVGRTLMLRSLEADVRHHRH